MIFVCEIFTNYVQEAKLQMAVPYAIYQQLLKQKKTPVGSFIKEHWLNSSEADLFYS